MINLPGFNDFFQINLHKNDIGVIFRRIVYLVTENKLHFLAVLLTIFLMVYTFGLLLNKSNKVKKTKTRIRNAFRSSKKNTFRRRDKMAFYMDKVCRKIKYELKEQTDFKKKLKSKPSFVENYPESRKYDSFLKLTKKDEYIPDELVLLSDCMKVYGLVDKNCVFEMCQNMKLHNYKAGEYVLKNGNVEFGILILVSGEVDIYLKKKEKSSLIKKMRKGQVLHSTFHILDYIVNGKCSERNIEAIATTDASVYMIPIDVFCEALSKTDCVGFKLAQMVIFRLEQVTFTIMDNVFGLKNKLYSNKFKFSVESMNSATNNSDCDNKITSNDLKLRIVEEIISKIGKDELKDVLIKNGKIMRFNERKLIDANSEIEPPLYFVYKGYLHYTSKRNNSSKNEIINTYSCGEFGGAFDQLIGGRVWSEMLCEKGTILYKITSHLFKQIVRNDTDLVYKFIKDDLKKISKFVKNFDFMIEWKLVKAGEAVYVKYEQSDKVYIVFNGRVQLVQHMEKTSKNFSKYDDKNVVIMKEFGHKDVIGIAECLHNKLRNNTLQAIRDSEIGIIPFSFLLAIKSIYPRVLETVTQILGKDLLEMYSHKNHKFKSNTYSTFAIVPASENVPINNFCFEFSRALEYLGSTYLLNSNIFSKAFPKLTAENCSFQTNWLSHLELFYDNLVFKADSDMTTWTELCLRQADVILIIGFGNETPKKHKLLEELKKKKYRRVKKNLILIHEAESFASFAHLTAPWLLELDFVSAHYHVRMSRKLLNKRNNLDKILKKFPTIVDLPKRNSDICRLTRILTGKSIGLVLGGGGARGLAHLGVLKALEDLDISIDMVGGTSMGAFVAAVYAMHASLSSAISVTKSISLEFSKFSKKLFDLTLPVVSLLTGRNFNLSIRDALGDVCIEDMLLPYFCVTVDLTSIGVRIHSSGSLWRYVRSSMSLPTYIPPLCDPLDGHLLVDGGFVNNLPANIMSEKGAEIILAVDVGSVSDTTFSNYGDTLSGWKVFFNKWVPFTTKLKVPTLSEIQWLLSSVTSYAQLNEVKDLSNVVYLRPPVENFGTLQFQSFSDIIKVGYEYMNDVLNCKNETSEKYKDIITSIIRKNSFCKKYLKNAILRSEKIAMIDNFLSIKPLECDSSEEANPKKLFKTRSMSDRYDFDTISAACFDKFDAGYISN